MDLDGMLFMYHGGVLKTQPHTRYEGGSVKKLGIETDKFCYWDLKHMVMKDLQYPGFEKMYYRIPGESLEMGLREVLNIDKVIMEMIEIVLRHKEIEVYIVHSEEDLLLSRGEGNGNNKKNQQIGVVGEPDESHGNEEEKGQKEGISELQAGRGNEVKKMQSVEKEHDANYIDNEILGSLDLNSFVAAKVTCREDGATHMESESDDSDEEEFARSSLKVNMLIDDDDSELEEAREAIRKFNMGHLDEIDTVMHEVRVDGHGGDIVRHENEANNEYEADVGDGNETDYPDTSDCGSFETSDGEECKDNAVRRKRKYPVHNANQEKPEFKVTMLFEDFKAFKSALLKYSIKNRIEFEYTKNNKLYVRAKCKRPRCPWKISAKYCDDLKCVQVKTYVAKHDCCPVFKNKRISSGWLAKNCFNNLSSINKLTLEELKEIAKKQLHLDVTLTKCWRAKDTVVQNLRGDATREYGKLWDYKAEIERSNPGTTVDLQPIRPALGRGKLQFDEMYFSFNCCKKGFLAGCRKVIDVDGCFLKGVVKGELLTAVGRDANNQMFPIAWGVVVDESIKTWTWFLKLLKTDLGITDGEGWTIMSDQCKGLLNAISKQLPQAEHRCCGRHLFANWRKKHKGLKMHRMFWSCVKATNEAEFNARMVELKGEDQIAHDDLLKNDKEKWCKAFFNIDVKCDIVDNNLCEAFNGKIIFARAKCIISMLEDIRLYIMRRLKKNRDLASRWSTSIGPRIKRKLFENIKESHNCVIEWNGSEGYEVRHRRDRHVVKLDKRICSCRAWMLSGIPCPHALCAIDYKGDDPETYIAHWYKKEQYLKTYRYMMQPVTGETQWPVIGKEALLPPPYRKMAGRPKLNMRREEWEKIRTTSTNMSRVGMKMRCKVCKKQGHNQRTCPEKEQGQQLDGDPQTVQANETHVENSEPARAAPVQPSDNIEDQVGQSGKIHNTALPNSPNREHVVPSQPSPDLEVPTEMLLDPLATSAPTSRAAQKKKRSILVTNTKKQCKLAFKKKTKSEILTQESSAIGHSKCSDDHMNLTASTKSTKPATKSDYIVITPQQLQSQCAAKRIKLEIKRKPWK